MKPIIQQSEAKPLAPQAKYTQGVFNSTSLAVPEEENRPPAPGRATSTVDYWMLRLLTVERERDSLLKERDELVAALNMARADGMASRTVLTIIADGRTTDAKELARTRLRDSYHSPNGDALSLARALIARIEKGEK